MEQLSHSAQDIKTVSIRMNEKQCILRVKNSYFDVIKKSPNEKVMSWLQCQDETTLYLSVLTFGEIQKNEESHIYLILQGWLMS